MKTKFRCFVVLFLLQSVLAQAGAIRNLPGFLTTVYGPNDDGSYPVTGPNTGVPPGTPQAVPIGFTVNFYGQTFTNLYINNNGNVTFDGPLGVFTPFGLVGTARQIVAAFFADVDTRAGNLVTFGNDVVDGHQAFGVNWIGVGYFDSKTDKTNGFQLILINRSDRNPGDFDIEFNYDHVQWETGDASNGQDGLGGNSAVAGFSDGTRRPGTSFQLSGSAIPRSFLDINPGGLIHNFLNTNVLGRYIIPIVNLTNTVLNVGRFSQGDPRWAANAYAGSQNSIQQQGCAVCCLAMALKYAGISTDPGQLNTLLVADQDFDGTAVIWGAATRDASSDTLEFHAHRSTDTQYLSQILAMGYPVIVRVSNSQGGSHFVLVIGEKNGQFLINDPGHANLTTLDAYNNDFETRGYVSDPPGDVSEFDISAGDTTEVLIVDPLGRRTGFDPGSGVVLEEIPQSVHFLDAIENSDLTGQPGTFAAHLLDLYQPLQGDYQIFLFPTKPGNYQATLRTFLANGTPGTQLTLQGTKAPNAVLSFKVTFGAAGVTSKPFTNQYPWTVTPTNGSLPLNVQFTAPAVDSGGHAVTNWYWSFGDGSISTDQNPPHTYTNAATYFPGLVAVNDAGSTLVSYGPSIVIPTVQYTANPTNGTTPMTVQFTTAGVDSGGNAVSGWSWDFGDGGTDTQQNPQHTYNSYGTFVPVLIATNSQGATVYGIGPSIASLPTTIQNGGFETGDFTSWTLVDNSEGTFVDNSSFSGLPPHSGGYLAALGAFPSPGSLSQSIATVPGQLYIISVWLDSPDGAAPNEFSVKWNGGTLFDQLDMPAIGWTNLQFTVKATGTTGLLQFGFLNELSYLSLDDISVVSTITPPLGVTHTGQNVILTWPTNAAVLTLKSTTNLGPSAVWNPVSPVPVTINGQNTVTNPASGKQMFYQLTP